MILELQWNRFYGIRIVHANIEPLAFNITDTPTSAKVVTRSPVGKYASGGSNECPREAVPAEDVAERFSAGSCREPGRLEGHRGDERALSDSQVALPTAEERGRAFADFLEDSALVSLERAARDCGLEALSWSPNREDLNRRPDDLSWSRVAVVSGLRCLGSFVSSSTSSI